MKLAVLINRAGPATAPLFRKLSEKFNTIVYYCSDFGVGRGDLDSDFNQQIDWGGHLLGGYKYKFLGSLEIINELLKNRPDALIVFGWSHYKFWLAYAASIVFKIPFFVWSENPLSQELLKKGFRQKIKKPILYWLFRKASSFFYIGQENRIFYKYYSVPDEKLFFMPYAVDNDYFMGYPKTEKEGVTILFVGSLIEKKRPRDLLKAYEELTTYNLQPTTYKKINLVFVGDGPLRKDLEIYVKDNNLKDVIFAGFKNQNEISRYYAMADIFVLPSGMGETWGLVINEAMCFGLPIIASDLVGSAKDLVRHSENGYVFQCGDISQLAEFLKDLIQDSDRRKVFGNKSLEIIKKYSYKEDILGITRALDT